MIDYVEIKNFRCFKHTRIKNFGKVNLIGGLNNVGKTALLEALLVGFFPTAKSFNLVRDFRNEGSSDNNSWQYFFLNKSTDENIVISLQQDKIEQYFTEISCQQDLDLVATTLDKDRLAYAFRGVANPSFVNVKGKLQGKEFDYFPLPKEIHALPPHVGNPPKNIAGTIPFLHSSTRKDALELTTLFSAIEPKKNIVIEALSFVDNRITDIKILTPDKKSNLFLSLKNQGDFPVNLFGDAIRKIIEVVLVLLNTSNSVVLIDEVENGLHYTKQAEFWRLLFGIAAKDTQIFATTHSKEMISSFATTAEQNPNVSATYFQLYRSGISGEIVAAPHDIDNLKFRINQNIPFRGETV